MREKVLEKIMVATAKNHSLSKRNVIYIYLFINIYVYIKYYIYRFVDF